MTDDLGPGDCDDPDDRYHLAFSFGENEELRLLVFDDENPGPPVDSCSLGDGLDYERLRLAAANFTSGGEPWPNDDPLRGGHPGEEDGEDDLPMDIHMQYIEHESQVTMALLDTSGEETERLDGASLGGYDLDAAEVKRAWEEAVLQKADYIRAKRRGWVSSLDDE